MAVRLFFQHFQVANLTLCVKAENIRKGQCCF